MKKFVIKNVINRPPSRNHILNNNSNEIKKDNNQIVEKPVKDMDTKEKVEMVNNILNNEENTVVKKNVKKIKNDKGLIEKTDITKTVITEDNKELLHD